MTHPTSYTLAMPQDGIAGLRQNWKGDLLSGFLVFLIALPLCLGISLASGFPPIAGIFTAIIGGTMVSILGSARLTIKGPAAGLIAIAIASVEELGNLARQIGSTDPMAGYKLTLAVIVAASVLQILFGILRAGSLGDFFPTSVVHGMLAAIGVIIFSKQFPVLLGVKPAVKEPLELLAHIPTFISNMNPEIALIGFISLLILFTLPLIKNKVVKKIPAPMVVLAVAVPLGLLFDLEHTHSYRFLGHDYRVGANFLVTLPYNMLEGITFPDFSLILTSTSIKYILMFALVGSIESLLTVKAMDNLDPYHRKSDMNRDLIAVGAGNTLAGLIGGLPMIAEVVRSSANINSGAKTRWSNFFHGAFLLVFVAFFPHIIHEIPLAALGAMLVFTGYRLASPREFKNTYRIGREQLLIFLTTLLVTLATDLLVGVVAGILMDMFIQMYLGSSPRKLFRANVEVKEEGDAIYVKINTVAAFTNYLGCKKHLESLPKGKKVIINFENTQLIDHTFMENIHHFAYDYHLTGGTVELEGLDYHKPLSDHPLAVRKMGAIKHEKLHNLTARQHHLQAIAQKFQAAFKPEQIFNHLKFKAFEFFHGDKFKKIHNRIVLKTEHGNLEYCEVAFSEGVNLVEYRYEMSVLTIRHLDFQLPDFILKKEGLMSKIWEKVGLDDIDFVKHPIFSDKYFLGGHDQVEIRHLFQDELISFFEEYMDFEVEVKHNTILVYRDKKLMSAESIIQLLNYSERLLQILAENRTKEILVAV
jgi:MFS superfamily sulfate permease-like transporter